MSFLDEIIEATLLSLEEDESMPIELLNELRELAASGKLISATDLRRVFVDFNPPQAEEVRA